MMTTPQAARLFGIDENTIRRWHSTGILEAHDAGPGTNPRLRIPAQALLRAFRYHHVRTVIGHDRSRRLRRAIGYVYAQEITP